jgi:protein-tyrosine-phosphatase
MTEKSGGSFLFVCVHNAGRSQIAEAFARRRGLKALNAGTMRSSSVNPIVVQAKKEEGVDISQNKPKLLTIEMSMQASLVAIMGCSVEEVCPRPMLAKMPKKLVDWNIETRRQRQPKRYGSSGTKSSAIGRPLGCAVELCGRYPFVRNWLELSQL